jgi:hypothetical protein
MVSPLPTNFLEFLGMIVTGLAYVLIPEHLRHYWQLVIVRPALLATGDNTSAIGWFFRSS